MKYFWPAMAAVLATCVYIVNSSKSDVRLFCAYGRVFIEFQEGYSTWGTIMLDNDGTPIRCNDDRIKTSVKDTI